METMQTLKAWLARLAGAPPGRSGLYRGVPEPTVPPRTTRQRDGDEAEVFARRWLERMGLEFVAANVRYRDGELDLVMRDTGGAPLRLDRLVFVEVRRRAPHAHGGAAASVTSVKRRRVVAAAAHYLVGLGQRVLPPCRFDVVAIDGDPVGGFRVEWIRDAFRDEGR